MRSLELWLKSEGFSTSAAQNSEDALKMVKKKPISVALVDYRLNGDDGIQTSNKLIEADEHLKVIIITGFPSYEIAVRAMKAGVFDYLSKGTSNDKIIKTIQRAIRERNKELLQSDGLYEEPIVKLILICNHALTIRRLEKYEKDSDEYKLKGTFRSVNHLKRGMFGQDVDIALICESCINKSYEKISSFFSDFSQYLLKADPVLITQSLSDEEKVQLLKLGVKGFIHPDFDRETMNKAFSQIKKGEIWASRIVTGLSIRSLVYEHYPTLRQDENANACGLTTREIEILENLVKGMRNREIADKLIISETTVKAHINKIFKKLGVTSRSKAILMALENDIV